MCDLNITDIIMIMLHCTCCACLGWRMLGWVGSLRKWLGRIELDPAN